MDKLRKDKWMGIATPVSLILALVLSSNVFAGPGKGKGPQSSISVFSVCDIEAREGYNSVLVVNTTITDKSSGTATAEVVSATIQGLQKEKGPIWDDLGLLLVFDGPPPPVEIPMCGIWNPLDGKSKAVNALISVSIGPDGSKDEHISRCKDDPETEDVNEAILKVADYPTLCNP